MHILKPEVQIQPHLLSDSQSVRPSWRRVDLDNLIMGHPTLSDKERQPLFMGWYRDRTSKCRVSGIT